MNTIELSELKSLIVNETDYITKAKIFADNLGLTMLVKHKSFDKYFPDDTESRDIYTITLLRDKMSYTFDFGQSIRNSQHYIISIPKHIMETYRISDLNPSIRKITNSTYSTISHTITPINWVIENFGNGQYNKAKMKAAINTTHIKGIPPSLYDVLCCLTKYDPIDFENFCGEYGCSTDSIKALQTFQAVQNEWVNISRMFTEEELEVMQEIQ